MLRSLLTILPLIAGVLSQGTLSNEVLEAIFGVAADESTSDGRPGRPTCEKIEGGGAGCYECYPCQHPTAVWHREQGHVLQSVRMNNGSCMNEEFCCVSQGVLLIQRFGDNCGLPNPDGAVRKLRKTPRVTLEGEYPWVAYLYKKAYGKLQLLCGMTFIDKGQKAFLARAKCARGTAVSQLVVCFDNAERNVEKCSGVKSVTVHPDYDIGTGHNDIALVLMASYTGVPFWAADVCLPPHAPQHATPCVAIADNNYAINTVIPRKKVCGQLHISQMCAIAPSGDFAPRTGSGLFCEDLDPESGGPVQQASVSTYVLYGIAISQPDRDVTTYTNVSHFSNWIKSELYD